MSCSCCNYSSGPLGLTGTSGITGTAGTSDIKESILDCFKYVGETDENFIHNQIYLDDNIFIKIISTCGSAKTSGLKYRREGWQYKFIGLKPQIKIKFKWYNTDLFVSLNLKESEYKIAKRQRILNGLV